MVSQRLVERCGVRCPDSGVSIGWPVDAVRFLWALAKRALAPVDWVVVRERPARPKRRSWQARYVVLMFMVVGLAATAFWFGFSSDEMFRVALGR